ncbi:MAG: ABC transporter substrate-binding protein [Hylemonella sp.]|nr:ABC transporter substrate-binding protein [Hylemonella sp.]
MLPRRRHFLSRAGQALALGMASGLATLPGRAQAPAGATQRVMIAVPGPGNIVFLPFTLAPLIRADVAEGLQFDLRYVSSGPQSMRDMLERNADFGGAGLAAVALQRISGQALSCIAPFTRVPGYTLMVRSELRQRVNKISDLQGLVVGVRGFVQGGRGVSQLFTEHVLGLNRVPLSRVNFVGVGQSYENQQAALATGTVDALMGDEPSATRLLRERVAFALADYHDLQQTRQLLGGLFLNHGLVTRDDLVAQQPQRVESVVRALTRTLTWIASHSPEQVVSALALRDEQERQSLLAVLQKHKAIFSPDGRFSAEQIATTERFFHATESSPAAQAFRLQSVVNARWAGTSA